MAETVFSRQLDAAQEAHQLRLKRKNRVVGRSWFNLTLAAILAFLASWVYQSPEGGIATAAPVVGRAQDALVQSFGGSLEQVVLQNQEAKAQQVVAAAEKEKADAEAAQAAAVKAAEKAKVKAAEDQTASTSTTAGPKASAPGKDGKTRAASAPSSSAPKATKPAPAPLVVPSKAAIVNPSTSYFGAAMSQTPFSLAPMEPFTALVGKRPNLVGGYQTWDNEYQPAATANSWKRGQLPMLSWEPMMATQEVKLADIAAGQYDEYVTRYATSIRDSGHPVALRFAHEMNGRWYSWSEGRFGNQPGDYVAAWQHVHNVFAQVGATNVVWVWSPNVVGSNRELPLSQVYPGDDYVDWAGLSGYYREDTGRTPTFNGTFEESLDAIREVTGKPILLSEIGVGTDVANRVTWLNSMFATLPEHPDVIGFVYFNYDKTTQEGSLQDWRLEFDPAVVETFKAGIADARYGAGF